MERLHRVVKYLDQVQSPVSARLRFTQTLRPPPQESDVSQAQHLVQAVRRVFISSARVLK